MTLASPSAPHAPPMTLASSSAPCAAPMTPPAPSSVAPVSPLAAQPVPHELPAGAVLVCPVDHLHPMQTRGAVGFQQHKLYIDATLSLLSQSQFGPTLVDPHCWAAMEEEYVALMSNDTWDLVLCPRGANVVTDKWIFKHKFKADGTLERYKACWVLRRFTQHLGVDYDETFSLFVNHATVRTIISLALSRDWLVHQLTRQEYIPP
jgi:hypothetical protein